jgi:hypothetical protein
LDHYEILIHMARGVSVPNECFHYQGVEHEMVQSHHERRRSWSTNSVSNLCGFWCGVHVHYRLESCVSIK